MARCNAMARRLQEHLSLVLNLLDERHFIPDNTRKATLEPSAALERSANGLAVTVNLASF